MSANQQSVSYSEPNMKPLIHALIVTFTAFASYGALAQANKPTRADVRAELVQLENAGYQLQVADNRYPEDLLAAQERVAKADESAYGSRSDTIMRAGHSAPIRQTGSNSIPSAQ